MNGRNGQGPAWGLKEQLARRKIDVEEQLSQATAASTGTHDHQDLSRSRPTRSKIRIPFSDDGLVKNIQQHFRRRDDRSNREVLEFCAQEVDRALSVLVQRVKTRVLSAIDRMDAQLLAIEGNVGRLCDETDKKGKRMARAAKRIADSEREEKAVLCQWLNGFLVCPSSDPSLSSMDFTLARFALNTAMASGRTTPEVMLNSGATALLGRMLSNSNPVVVGPAVMALSQMARHRACQRSLGLAGVIPPLVLLCFSNQSSVVLIQTCIALAQLSRYIPNKAIIAGKGGVAAIVHLLKGYTREERITVEVVGRALTALVNVVHWSDANRGLAEECGAAGPILTIMETVDDESVLVQACFALANMSFCNYFAALRLLAAGADNVACDLIRSSDMTRHSDVVEAALVFLANLANNALNQSHVGASSAIELAVSACKHCGCPRVVRAAALALCSMTLNNSANKARCASFDAVPVLLKLGTAWGVADDGDRKSDRRSSGPSASPTTVSAEEEAAAATQTIRCVAILAQHPTNALAMKKVGGLEQLIGLIHDSEHNEVMIAAAKAVVVSTPGLDALVRTFRSGKSPEIEMASAHQALMRVREWAFGRTSPPSWLAYGLDVLGYAPEALEARLQKEAGISAFYKRPEEFFTHSEFFEERDTIIPPDVTLAQDEDLGGMLFHMF